jgi:putative membrane protein
MQALLGAGAFLLAGASSLLRVLVPRGRATESVERRAREEFLEHRVFETRDRTGVLLLLSELEHQVVLLGDKGIDAEVHQEGWARHVQTIVDAIRRGQPADGVCAVIAELGALLAKHAPARDDNYNELSNAVRRDDG